MELILQFASSQILFRQFCAFQNHNCLLYTKNESIKFEISTKSLTLRVPDFFQVLSIWEGSTPHLAYFGGRGDSSSGKSSFQQYFYQDHHVSVRKITSANKVLLGENNPSKGAHPSGFTTGHGTSACRNWGSTLSLLSYVVFYHII